MVFCFYKTSYKNIMNSNEMFISEIIVDNNRVDISFFVKGDWETFFVGNDFFCEYSESVRDINESIAIIPFLGNVLPIAWYLDATIHVGKCDESFYNCLDEVKNGYISMYPNIRFGGDLIVDSFVQNTITPNGSLVFFSGGVDANYTLYNHLYEKPELLTVWGADIKLDDNAGWKEVKNSTLILNRDFKANFVKSNFRTFIDESKLTHILPDKSWNWWHEFQHGMGLITLAAPLAICKSIDKIYIAASYTKEVENLTCASDPRIDNYIKFCGIDVFHDGYDANRQDKIEYLVDYSKENCVEIPLRVCWTHGGGKNCCRCEKCCRTMMAIWLAGGAVTRFGFDYVGDNLEKVATNMHYKNSALERDWDIIHQKIKSIYTEESVPRCWKWFYIKGVSGINHNCIFLIYLFMKKVYRKIREFL